MSLIGSLFFTPQLVFMRTTTLPHRFIRLCKKITPLFLAIFFLSPIKLLSQSGDLDQVRNGPANDPSKNFYDNFPNPTWVNGNAGASNAHYVEGHSIGYRSLITGATPNLQYEYIIEYDTKHSGRMAIDYLTHFQRLLPHNQFGHAAEVLNPRILESGSVEYLFNVKDSNTFPIPAPNQTNPNTPVAGMPQNSFNALSANEKLFTIYNGVITSITYITQQSLTTGATESKTSVKIRFTAHDDSVLLAWGGHIASQLDWGFINPTTPRSAAGISGSPYHMRQISMNTYPGLVNISGVGNQDRSLSANAVIPPPSCSISPAQLACPETASLTFNYTGGTANTTFAWSINAGNTAGAVISGSATGSSVLIVPSAADFVPGGTFNLTLNVTANGITQTCTLSPAGTIQNVQVVASANPTTINLAAGNTSQLSATVTPAPNTLYSFSWAQDPPTGGSLSASNISNPVFTATQAGTYQFIVTATQLAAPNCVAKDTVEVTVTSSSPPCEVTGPTPVCPGSTNTYNGPAGAIPANFTYTWSLVNNTNNAAIQGATNGTSVSVKAGTSCNTSYTVHLHIESTSGLIKVDCEKTVSVEDKTPPTITSCPADATLECDADTAASKTGTATATDNCSASVSYVDNVVSRNCFTYIERTWTATDPCGNTSSCVQRIILTDRTKPVLANCGNINVNCGDPIPPATATDNCTASGNITLLYKDVAGAASGCQSNPNNITRTWTAIDASGNIQTCTQIITFVSNARLATGSQGTTTTTAVTTVKTTPPAANLIVPAKLTLQAAPNPYQHQVTFKFTSPTSGEAVLAVYNMLGSKLAIIYKGQVAAGSTYTIDYRVPLAQRVPLIYKLNIGTYTTQGKLLTFNRF
jgi:hypothetical protein